MIARFNHPTVQVESGVVPIACVLVFNCDDLQEMIVYGQFYLPLSAVYWIMKKDEFRTIGHRKTQSHSDIPLYLHDMFEGIGTKPTSYCLLQCVFSTLETLNLPRVSTIWNGFVACRDLDAQHMQEWIAEDRRSGTPLPTSRPQIGKRLQ